MTARIPILDPAAAEGQARELFNVIKSKFGMVPNDLKTMGQAPAVLDGYLSLNSSLAKGNLTKAQREQIALAVSQENGCEYCLAVHSLTAKLAGLTPDQVAAARRGKSTDRKAQAVLNLAHNILQRHGKVSDSQLAEARAAGLTDAEVVEVVGNVAVMTLTNFLNNVAQPDIDFPRVALSA